MDIKSVQQRLLAIGYRLPKFGADGFMGAETAAVLSQYQRAHGLPVTGQPDALTLADLFPPAEAHKMDRGVFYAAVRSSLFAGKLTQYQVEGFEVLLNALEADRDDGTPLSLDHAAYMLATAYHETAYTMHPVRETLASSDDEAIRILDLAFARGRLPWVRKPYWRKDADGKSWLGRGYVQLTHKANYQKAAEKTGIDFVGDPSLAMVPEHAAVILIRGMDEGWFTGRTLDDYLDGVDESDAVDLAEYRASRPIINGTDKAAAIAGYALKFEAALKAAGF
ncbi:peptidoglycan-binding protein [Rhizobium alvei]|uniref:Peptidoglycan-binding protein n=1 Tax=Rhizobium alvei TaxID=1132659 RepID=A0ABT8YQ23_9HYPH|nr:peptidoglycan-binding protein [Rhizobium alvei]MDO6965802.1 peptidoglycan-binding protein [Rhizobium alvei]